MNFLNGHTKDGLVKIDEKDLLITDLGAHFAPQIANVFDKFDPPNTSYDQRLKKIKEIQKNPS